MHITNNLGVNWECSRALGREKNSLLPSPPASMSELMSEVESMNSLLSHIEGYITRQDAGQTETPIAAYLRNLKLISEDERLPRHIPNSVLLQHFVEFRITLRGLAGVHAHPTKPQSASESDYNYTPLSKKYIYTLVNCPP